MSSLAIPMEARPRRLKSFLIHLGFSEIADHSYLRGPISVRMRAGWDGIELHHLEVASDQRRQGHASGLMDEVIRAANLFRLPIVVAPADMDEEARHLFSRKGFRPLPHGPWSLEKLPDTPSEPPAPVVMDARRDRKGTRIFLWCMSALMLISFVGSLLHD